MTPEILVQQLKSCKEYLDRSTRALTEEDSSFAPTEGEFTVAQQMGHIGLTVDWFVEGGFGKGFVLNEEGKIPGGAEAIAAIKSLEGARSLCAQSFSNAIQVIGSKSAKDVLEMMPDNPIMGVAPRMVVVHGIEEHTAHHRGSLSVYTRMLGKVPPMPYMDAEVPA
jgi:uncharacterized damage-inducible protein DinB